MTQSRKDIEEKISKTYHQLEGLKNSNGQNISSQGDTVLHGDDDRKDYFSLEDSGSKEVLMRRLADATVILTSKSSLTRNDDGSFELDVDDFQRGGRPPCAEERFKDQHIGGWCSGFMVGRDLIATAGHCGKTESDIQETAYIFGFKVSRSDDLGTTIFLSEQVYFGKELVAHDLSETGDFAVVRVDREITAPGSGVLEVRRSGRISVGENLGVIGYPSGLPVKIAFGEETVVMRDEDPWLISNLDTYGGNSGSPVFNSDGLVEGILVRGARDYITDYENDCFMSNQMANVDGSEAITKAKVFVDKLPVQEE